MATYHVSSSGSNTSPYDTWAKAATSFATAVSAATAAGSVILVDSTLNQAISSDTTFTLSSGVQVMSANVGTSTYEAGATIYGSAGGVDLIINGGPARISGMVLKGGNGTAIGTVKIGYGDSTHIIMDRCILETPNTGNNSFIQSGSNLNSFVFWENCVFKWGKFNHYFLVSGPTVATGNDFHSQSPETITTGLIGTLNNLTVVESDFSSLGTNPIFRAGQTGSSNVKMTGCKLNTAAPANIFSTALPIGSIDLEAYDCSSGDEHFHIYHENFLGSTAAVSSIYANDNVSGNVSWVVASTANVSGGAYYKSPYFHKYKESSATPFTPSVEIFRSGSSTPYTEDQIYSEFRAKTVSGSTIRTGQESGDEGNDLPSGVATWTGGTGWAGKLEAAAPITAAENGYVSARVCLVVPSIAVYVDPQIRGL